MKYKLSVSYNCGVTYGVERESDDLEELKKAGKELDEQMLRWDIEDENGEAIECCAIHKSIIGFMGKVRKQETEKRLQNFLNEIHRQEIFEDVED